MTASRLSCQSTQQGNIPALDRLNKTSRFDASSARQSDCFDHQIDHGSQTWDSTTQGCSCRGYIFGFTTVHELTFIITHHCEGQCFEDVSEDEKVKDIKPGSSVPRSEDDDVFRTIMISHFLDGHSTNYHKCIY